MRRLVVPLLIGLIICITAGPAFGQQPVPESEFDSIGFGYKLRDTLRALPGELIDLPVFLSTDSTVTALSMLFDFDTSIIWPQIAFDQDFDDMLNDTSVIFKTDSADYKATTTYDSGLWNVQMYMEPEEVGPTWDNGYGTYQVLYNLRNRGHARLLLNPIPPFDSLNYIQPYISGELGDDDNHTGDDDGGGVIAYIKCRVSENAEVGTVTQLNIEPSNEDAHQTEMAQKHDSSGHILTKAVFPYRMTATFIVSADTADTTEPPPEGENHIPVLIVGGNPSYTVNPGQQVSFTVTATDEEGGEVRITANGGSLPPNASFGTSGLVVGGGGIASGTFSFVPDVSQQGSFIFSFVATDDSSASSGTQQRIVTVARPEVDILYTSSADGLSPVGGVPGLNEVMVPINIVTNNIIYGIQFDMDYDANSFDLDSVITSDRVSDWVIYDNVGVDPGFLRVVAFGLASDSMVPGTTSAALFVAFSVDEFAAVGSYPLDIYNAWESIDPDPGVPSLDLETDSGVIYVDQWGDVNLDQHINVADLVNTVAFIIGTYDLNRRQFAAGDIVINDTVNVIDLVGIINVIFGLPVSPSPAPDLEDEFATLNLTHEEISGAGIESEMKVLADMPTSVAGVELEIQYNPGTVQMLKPILADGSDGFLISSSDNGAGYMKVLIYSDHPWNEQELIRQGLSDIVKLPFVSRGRIARGDNRQVQITRAYVSTGAAKNVRVEGVNNPIPSKFELYQNRPNPFNPVTTIDFYISGSDMYGDEQVNLEVFNILGQKIRTLVDNTLPPGQHTVDWDGTDDHGDQLASGVYLYRLIVGDERQTKKMMLLK
jgi:hypothetical protein